MAPNGLKERFYPESRLSGFSDVDGTIAFYSQVNALIDPASILVDVGCGRGAYLDDPVQYRLNLRKFQGKCTRVIGIDIDPKARDNQNLDEFRLITGNNWPIETSSANLILGDYILEHVANPDLFFTEAYRILKPGGAICLRTSNLYSYFGLLAKLIPNQLHIDVLLKAKESTRERDTFPTCFQCNTIPKIRRTMRNFKFFPIVYGYDAEPAYLSSWRFLYLSWSSSPKIYAWYV